MFDTRERCVDCLKYFTVFWGETEKKAGKRKYYATSQPAVQKDGYWLCADCAEKRKRA